MENRSDSPSDAEMEATRRVWIQERQADLETLTQQHDDMVRCVGP